MIESPFFRSTEYKSIPGQKGLMCKHTYNLPLHFRSIYSFQSDFVISLFVSLQSKNAPEIAAAGPTLGAGRAGCGCTPTKLRSWPKRQRRGAVHAALALWATLWLDGKRGAPSYRLALPVLPYIGFLPQGPQS